VLETWHAVVSSKHFMMRARWDRSSPASFSETQGIQVKATVKNGIFTAWWPQRKPASLFGRLVDNPAFNASPNSKVKITPSNGKTITEHVKDYDVNH
jgi:hypothetical protein